MVQLLYEVEEQAVGLARACSDVGSAAQQVVAVWGASHEAVQLGTSVAMASG